MSQWANMDFDDLRVATIGFLSETLPAGWIAAVAGGDEVAQRALDDQLVKSDWWSALAAARLVAPHWPERFGGLGLSAEQAQVVQGVLAEYRTPRSTNPIGLTLVGPALIRWGTDDQTGSLLPRLLAHIDIWCQLFSEPDAGSDLASLATRATRSESVWEITGQKVWTSLAHTATHGLCLARTNPDVPKHQGITTFLVDLRSPGVEIHPLRQATGDADFNEVFLDGVAVPDHMRLGPVDEGWTVARSVLAVERVANSGAGAALRSTLSGRSVRSILDRYAPVTDPGIRDRLMELWIEDKVIRLVNQERAAAREEGDRPRTEGAVTKLFQAEFTQRLQDLAVELAGIDGIAWEEGDRWADKTTWSFLYSRSRTVAAGTSQIMRNVIGESILGLPREPDPFRDAPWRDTPRSVSERA
jgi:alkylation response protein AidB-like acyl-CoA dehydrogenase